MSDELKIPAGSPVNINLGAAAPAAPVVESESKSAKREAAEAKAKAQGQNEVLKALGVKKSERARVLEEVKAGRIKLAETKAELEDARAQAAAATQQVDAFKPYKDQVEQLTGALKEYADAEFSALPEAFQKTLVEMKLDDPRQRLDMIKVFKKTGILGATQAAKTDEAATKKTVSPSTTMAAAPNAKDSPSGQALNYYEQWKRLTDSGQSFLAAQYMNVHMQKIIDQRPTK